MEARLDNRLVATCVDILRLVSNQKAHVNNIIRQTSNDRTHVISAIRILKKAGLVRLEKEPKFRQRKFFSITGLGKEITDFVESIEKYEQCLSNLKKSKTEKFHLKDLANDNSQQSVFKEILRTRGWRIDEISNWKELEVRTHEIELDFQRIFIDILLLHYSALLFQYEPSAETKCMLDKIVVDAIYHHFLHLIEDYSSIIPDGFRLTKGDKIAHIFSTLGSPVLSILEKYSVSNDIYHNRFIQRELQSMISSTKNILQPPLHVLDIYIKHYKKELAGASTGSRSNDVKNSLKFFENLYREASSRLPDEE